jgi:hypothetical protein
MTTNVATEALVATLTRKVSQVQANGATEDQAVAAVRSLWLEAVGRS